LPATLQLREPAAPRAGTAVAASQVMSDSTRNSAHSFTELEEEFFRAGSTPEELAKSESFADLDAGNEQPSLWRRLFGRVSADRRG
jgi:hypothetical protein